MISDTAPTPQVPQDDCSALFLRALHGNGDAATQLYRACIPPLQRRLAGHMLWTDAEDIAHDALLLAFRHAARFQPEHSFRAWLHTIASRLASNHGRNESRRRSRELAFVEFRSLERHEEADSPDHQSHALARGIHQLSKAERQLLAMRYAENRTPSEIAALLGSKRITISVRLHRTCEKLRTRCTEALSGTLSNGIVRLKTTIKPSPAT